MWQTLRRCLWRQPLASAALAVAFVAFMYFGWRLIDDSRGFHRQFEREPAIAAWMSPRYVGRRWNLSRDEVLRIMEIDARADRDTRPRTVADVLARNGLTLEELRIRLEATRERDRGDGPNDRSNEGPNDGNGRDARQGRER